MDKETTLFKSLQDSMKETLVLVGKRRITRQRRHKTPEKFPSERTQRFIKKKV